MEKSTFLYSRRWRLPIERYALVTESAPELGRTLDDWYRFYQPGSPGECVQLDTAVMARVQQQRVHACLTATVNEEVRSAIFRFDCDQEDEVQRYRDMLDTRPGAAIVGLNRSALGLRFLIGRWERLLRLIKEEGTLYGSDVDECIHYQGAKAKQPENLFESEGAYLTWIYCLMSQPAPRDEDFVAIGNERYMPRGLNDRDGKDWLGTPELCRKLLRELAERELAHLRPREVLLRTNYEDPARNSAEVRMQVLQGPVAVRLQREAETHERHFHRAYSAFLKGRAQSEKSGRLPGAPIPDLHPESVAAPEQDPDTRLADQAGALRKAHAAAVAPGGQNAIGAANGPGDVFRGTVTENRGGPDAPREEDSSVPFGRAQ